MRMSHDQKPGKVRVVGGAAALASRRRADVEPVASTISPADRGASAAAEVPRSTGRKSMSLLLAALFVVGCGVGGAALPLLRGL